MVVPNNYVPSAGDVCVLYATSPAGLVPYSASPNATACSCYAGCRAEYVCDARYLCAANALRKDCRRAKALVDDLQANPCDGWVRAGAA